MKRKMRLWAMVFLAAVVSVPCARTVRAEPAMALGEILRRTEAQYQQMQAFTSYFRQVTTSSAASSVANTEAFGRLYYKKPRQMRWEYEKPESQIFVANNELAWLYVPSENQASLFDAGSFFSSPLARTFFDGIVELKKNFQVSLDSKQSTKAVAVLKLIPREEDPNIKSLLLWIDMETFRIQSIESRDALGNMNRIVLESQQPASDLDTKLFQLDLPPSTPLVDMEGRELSPQAIERLKQKLLPR